MKKLFLVMSLVVLVFLTGCSNNTNLEMVTVEAGTTSEDNGALNLGYNLELGKYEVTFSQYIDYCNDTGAKVPDDEGWGKNEQPVMNVSWFQAVQYCNWLSETKELNKAYDTSGDKKTWKLKAKPQNLEGYRLPTKKEWEYAARGGVKGRATKYAGSDKIHEVAWYDFNSDFKTHPVGQKKPNELGAYDMTGNVWEWTTSRKGSKKVHLGGSYNNVSQYCKINTESSYNQYSQSPGSDLGFRIVKTKKE